MLFPSMDISYLMLHGEQIEKQKLKQDGRELKKVSTVMGILLRISLSYNTNHGSKVGFQ